MSMKPPGNPYTKQIGDIAMLWHRTKKGKDFYGIERVVLIVLAIVLMLMPAMVVRWLGGMKSLKWRKIAIDTYAVSKPVLLIFLLWSGYGTNRWVAAVAGLFVVDLYAYLLGIVLLREFWSAPFSHSRSLILLTINFSEIIAAFAVFYVYFGCLMSEGHAVTGWSDAFYFSAVTSATVGYGDITPSHGAGRLLATIQIFASVGFMALFVAYFVGNINQKRTPVGDTRSAQT